MKQLNIYFEDSEYKELSKIKRKLKITWHDLFMKLVEKEMISVLVRDIKNDN